MVCQNCGTNIDENQNFCPNCGAARADCSNTSETTEQKVTDPAPQAWSKKAITGFVLSLIGLIVAALPCGITGLVFSSIALTQTANKNLKGKGLAISGLVISLIDVVFGFVNIMTPFYYL